MIELIVSALNSRLKTPINFIGASDVHFVFFGGATNTVLHSIWRGDVLLWVLTPSSLLWFWGRNTQQLGRYSTCRGVRGIPHRHVACEPVAVWTDELCIYGQITNPTQLCAGAAGLSMLHTRVSAKPNEFYFIWFTILPFSMRNLCVHKFAKPRLPVPTCYPHSAIRGFSRAVFHFLFRQHQIQIEIYIICLKWVTSYPKKHVPLTNPDTNF